MHSHGYFHKCAGHPANRRRLQGLEKHQRTLTNPSPKQNEFDRCTNSGHPAVRQLQPIEIAAHKLPTISLTKKIKGVKTISFFDTF
jgi:hypothetical protein